MPLNEVPALLSELVIGSMGSVGSTKAAGGLTWEAAAKSYDSVANAATAAVGLQGA